uniref:Nucleoporin NUP35 n=1 Tax=Panagrolaimus superbus TaxID=310955 RepID=A0A914YEV2_9BILA
MDFSNSFASRRFYGADAINNSTLNSSARFNGINRNLNENNDIYRDAVESPLNFTAEESARNNSDIQRRSTFTGMDSPFTTRRRIMLQSTPITNRRIGDRVPPIPNFDVSTITTANENTDNKQRAAEDRSCVPHFFGTAALAGKPIQRDETYINRLIDNDTNPALKPPSSSRTLFSPSCSRSNTFANRKDLSGRESRFSPYPQKIEKESRLSNGGPPLRSLNDSKPKIKRKHDDDSLIAKSSPPPEDRDFWVTVFGYDKQKGTERIIELFSRHGQIVKTACPVIDGNWIHIRYATKMHVEQALQRNGEIIDNYFIGCIQASNVPYGSDSSDWNIATPSVNNTAADNSVHNISLSSPQPSNRYIPGMRSLAVPSPNAPTPPSKGSSLISFLFKGKNAE